MSCVSGREGRREDDKGRRRTAIRERVTKKIIMRQRFLFGQKETRVLRFSLLDFLFDKKKHLSQKKTTVAFYKVFLVKKKLGFWFCRKKVEKK